MSFKTHIIACGVMELDFAVLAEKLGQQLSCEYLEAGLHATPAELRRQLQHRINIVSDKETMDRIVIGYGICGRGVVGIKARNVPLVVPRVHDCISLFLGSNAAYKEQFTKCPGTFYISAGWYDKKVQPLRQPNRKEPFQNRDAELARLTPKYGAENAEAIVDFLSSWQRNYQRAVFIDTGSGDRETYESYAKAMAAEFGWEYERVEGNQSLLEQALTVPQSTPELLCVPPEHVIRFDPIAGGIIAVPPWEDDGHSHTVLKDFTIDADNAAPEPQTRLGLGIDAGGTYTDAVVYDFRSGEVLTTGKALTTKWDYTIGIEQAVAQLECASWDEVDLVSVSTTLATNAIVEGQGQTVGLLIMPPGGKVPPGEIQHDPYAIIPGRLDIHGEETQAIDPDAVRKGAKRMVETDEVMAFAVSGYGGAVNPAHEAAVKQLLREEFHLPVVCGHELSDQLNFFVRANTAVLNARIIPVLQAFLEDVRTSLDRMGVSAPIAVVKGDGSLMSTDIALERPIETILSGPAASVSGARYLTELDDATVLDIGGTTSDLASVRRGRVNTRLSGARVGGWSTHVRALDMRTVGLGGDSNILFDKGELTIGPRRVAPVGWLVAEHESGNTILSYLEACFEDFKADTRPMQILVATGRQPDFALNDQEEAILAALQGGPLSLVQLASKAGVRHWKMLKFERLEQHYLVFRCGLTPTDVLHVLERLELWDSDPSRRLTTMYAELVGKTVDDFAEDIVDRVSEALAVQLIKKQLDAVTDADAMDECDACQVLLQKVLSNSTEGLHLKATLDRPVIGLGAPAAYFMPEAVALLHGELIIPDHAAVANAVGAITSWVTVNRQLTIQPDEIEGFLLLGLGEGKAFETVDEATKDGARMLAEELIAMARNAGTSSRRVEFNVDDRIAADSHGSKVFLERVIVGQISGPPDLIHV